MITIFKPILIFVLILNFTSIANADIVTLKDGTVLEGIVIKETGAEVVIEITVFNIKTTKTFPRYKVKSILIQPIEQEKDDSESPSIPTSESSIESSEELKDDSSDDAANSRKPTRRRAVAKEKPTLVMTIPVTGTLGVEFNHKGLRAALNKAKSIGIHHVIFEINIDCGEKFDSDIADSDLGYFYAAEDCLEVLEEFSDEIQYNSIISNKCHPSSSVFLAYSKHIFIRPRSTIGALVWYLREYQDIESDALARLMPEIQSLTEKHGHQYSIFESLMLRKTEAWQLMDGSIVTSRPNEKCTKIDNSSNYLILDTDDLVKSGFAQLYNKPIKKIGEFIGVKNLKITTGLGLRMIKPARTEYLKYETIYRDTLGGINKARSRLEHFDPRNIHPDQLIGEFQTDDNGQVIFSDELVPTELTLTIWKKYANTAIYNSNVILEGSERLKAICDFTVENGIEHMHYPEWLNEDILDSVREAKDWITTNKLIIPGVMFSKHHRIDGWKLK